MLYRLLSHQKHFVIAKESTRMPMIDKNISILMVYDEPGTLLALADVLGNSSLRTANCSDAALKIVRTEPADIIIVDIDGASPRRSEFLAQLCSICPESECILFAAPADTTYLNTLTENRISTFLLKPVNIQQFRLAVERLAEIIQLRRSRADILATIQNSGEKIEEEVLRRSASLQASNQDLKDRQQIREQMTRMAVHDLKTPLANIRLAVNGLCEYCSDVPDVCEMASVAFQSIDTMTTLVENILSIANLTKSEFVLKDDIVVPADLIRSSIAAFRQAAFKKSITIGEDITGGMVETIADAQQLRHVLDNLISNAIKYTHPGGRIDVSVHFENDAFVIRVADTGQGMSGDDINNAFQEFRRLSALPTGGESSSGLGLFIVKKIVDLHGGKVFAESSGKNMGSTFTVVLPMRPVGDLSFLNI
jgi:signal transduction histidine kinase